MTHWYGQLLAGDFATFIGKTLATINPGSPYLPNWHIELIADYLEAARRGEITRLIINLPPRSLKSTCVSVAWPAWILGHDPSARIMAASYASNLALKHSLDSRAVITSDWYRHIFPHTLLTRDQNEKQKFMTTRRGFRFSTSVGASAIGEGGNFLIIDDPQTPAQAMSPQGREWANSWFDHSFSTRLDDKKKGVMVLVMQRLHEQDLTGYLLKKGGWDCVSLPAIAPRDMEYTIAGKRYERQVGSLLHAAREDAALTERAKIELGSAGFAAQYQQQPMPEEGAMFRPWWLKRHSHTPPGYQRCVQSWDTAIKAADHHDASACLTFLEHEGVSYLAEALVVRLEYPDLKRAVLAQAKRWNADAILMEDKASGQQLLQDIRRETHLPLIAIQPKGSKHTRAAAISALIEAGKLSLPEQACWLADFEKELFSFPASEHDDQIDALSQYLDWQRNQSYDQLRIRHI
ncbi:MAG: phage terminase large subunit [Rickettsiales bacterium]|nr:phage terminase large subunit [Rickettsiales bacterium]